MASSLFGELNRHVDTKKGRFGSFIHEKFIVINFHLTINKMKIANTVFCRYLYPSHVYTSTINNAGTILTIN